MIAPLRRKLAWQFTLITRKAGEGKAVDISCWAVADPMAFWFS